MTLNEGTKAGAQRALEGAQLFKACPHPTAWRKVTHSGKLLAEEVTARVTHSRQGRSFINQQPQPSSALTPEPMGAWEAPSTGEKQGPQDKVPELG